VEKSLRNVYASPEKATPAPGRPITMTNSTLRQGNRHAALTQRFDQMAQEDRNKERVQDSIAKDLPALILWGAEDRLIPVADDPTGSRKILQDQSW